MKTLFGALVASLAVLVGVNTASANHNGVAVRVGGGNCYHANVGVAVATATGCWYAVQYPVAMAYPVAAPVVADPIPYSAPVCEPAVSAPVCVQMVSAPVAFAAPSYSVQFAAPAYSVVLVNAVAVHHNVVRVNNVVAVHHNVAVRNVAVRNVGAVRVNIANKRAVRVANRHNVVNQRVNVRNGLFGQRITIRSR